MAFSQRDPAWAGEKLGFSGWTIGDSGCLLTAMCNVAGEYGHYIDPPTLNQEFKNRGIDASSLGGADLSKVFPDIEYRGFTPFNIAVNYDLLRVNGRIGTEGIIKMDSMPNVAGIQLHFSRLRGVDDSGYVVIDDSWTGQRARVSDSYGNQEAAIWGVDLYYKAPEVVVIPEPPVPEVPVTPPVEPPVVVPPVEPPVVEPPVVEPPIVEPPTPEIPVEPPVTPPVEPPVVKPSLLQLILALLQKLFNKITRR
jgi:hypothetical protein